MSDKTAKDMLAERLNKTVSREMAVIILAGYGLIEQNVADPQLLVIFSATVIAILQGAKAIEAIFDRKKGEGVAKAARVVKANDTQERPTDGPEFTQNP